MEIKLQNGERKIVPSHQCVCVSQMLWPISKVWASLVPYSCYVQFCGVPASSHRCSWPCWPQIHSVWSHFLPSGLWVMLWVGPHGNVLSTHMGDRRRPWGESLPSDLGVSGELLTPHFPLLVVAETSFRHWLSGFLGQYKLKTGGMATSRHSSVLVLFSSCINSVLPHFPSFDCIPQRACTQVSVLRSALCDPQILLYRS